MQHTHAIHRVQKRWNLALHTLRESISALENVASVNTIKKNVLLQRMHMFVNLLIPAVE